MRLFHRISLVISFCAFFPLAAYADSDQVREALLKAMPNLGIDEITESPAKGLYEVTSGPNLYYVSEDAKYLLIGNMYDLQADPAKRDLTEAKVRSARANVMKKVGLDQVIQFKSPSEKHVVSVFTDVDCGYCRKLHSEINDYLDQGITINYLFYPRAGLESDSFKKAVAVWCADDRQGALTKAKLGEEIEMKDCANPVNEHVKLATALRIQGTPLIVTEDGSVLPGYVPAVALSERLVK